KFTIKEVMQKAHKGDLLKKVLGGKASAEEKEELVLSYTALQINKPPRGDEKSWEVKTQALIDTAKAVAKDDKDKKVLVGLEKASSGAACHSVHKPPKAK